MNRLDLIIDALERANELWLTEPIGKQALAAARELKALAQPEQEPVCDKDPSLCGFTLCQLAKVCKHTPRNTMPIKIVGPNLEQILNAAGFYKREWVGLTSEDWENTPNTGKQGCERDVEMFDWIEQTLKDKNT